MSHVFISYARSDEPLASLIADGLREGGFEVWRDDELPAFPFPFPLPPLLHAASIRAAAAPVAAIPKVLRLLIR